MARAAITIDLDSIYCYQRIYGLKEDRRDNSVYEIGLERFVKLMDELGLVGTVFVVGGDLDMGDNADLVRSLSKRGFEIANHSMTHDYRLTRLDDALMRRELEEGRRKIEAASGEKVLGFRAPGYTMNDRLMAAVRETGHRYDSSLFPCLPYYVAKAGVLSLMAITGKRSHSILGGLEALAAPRGPYRPRDGAYWRPGGDGVWELPISTSPVLRFPFLGSFIILFGEKRFPLLYRMLNYGASDIVLELHGMDFLDGRTDGLDPALMKQPDLAVAWSDKAKLFRRVFRTLRDDHEVLPLRGIVEELGS